MPDILDRLGKEVLVVDGAMGTMLQRAGMVPGQCPEQLNVSRPEMVLGVHSEYAAAGADCVTTNTFGGSRVKLEEYGLGDQVDDFNRAGVRLARSAGSAYVLADMGPTGLVMEPLGPATFDSVFALFAEQARSLASESPDAFILETFTDIAEARCAVLAVRSVTDIPVLVTVTFGQNGRMALSGSDPETAAVILAACGASAVGMNCGLGPDQMLPLLEGMASATDLPLIVQPNAGLPRLEDGLTVFPGTSEEMGDAAARFAEIGASVLGSCCGSTPAFTAAISASAKGARVRRRPRPTGVALAGPRGVVRVGAGHPLAVIGERINPTGKASLAASLRAGSMETVRTLAAQQSSAGADMLDVNVGAAGIDAGEVLPRVVLALAGTADRPLVLDSTDPVALEAALKVYAGRALVNSVHGGADSMGTILPLAARFGAAVVVLALDDEGIPETAGGRLTIVDRVREAAHAVGLSDDDLVVDCLVMTAATDPGGAAVTLKALRSVSSDRGLATVLGISNVSHGLPGRSTLNATFLSMAVADGLSAAMINPAEVHVPISEAAADVLCGRDPLAAEWISLAVADVPAGRSAAASRAAVASPEDELVAAVGRGDIDAAPRLVDELVAGGVDPRDVIAGVLTPAIQEVGEAYARGEVFLPQLMVAADAMKAAVERVRSHLPEGERGADGRVAFCTVKGDIHSIGKDICISLLESQGFAVNDLGVDVPSADVVTAAREADAVCLSALMTTTLPAMAATVAAVREALPGLPVLVGGAVVTAEWASAAGALYAQDAPGCVGTVKEALAVRDR